MKKYYFLIIVTIILGLVLTGCSLLSNISQVPANEQMKVKPTENLAGAVKVPWNLSGAVMPVPPWGLSDIPGSDTASKLIVNQPNGNTEVTITGAMNGLKSNTEYTVCLSNAWSTSEKWNITGDWELDMWVVVGGPFYEMYGMTVTSQNMYTGVFSGTLQSNTNAWIIQETSKVIGDIVNLDLIHKYNSGYTVQAEGTIDTDGAIINGSWSSSAGQSGTWNSILGNAEKETVGNGYPGQFPGQIRFTFTTDECGAGDWHINLRDSDFTKSGDYTLSVWINGAGKTILISDNFEVKVD